MMSDVSEVAKLLADAAGAYRAALRQAPSAVAYLSERGIGGAIAGRFGLGFAPAHGRALQDVLSAYDAATVEAAGLVVQRGHGRGAAERFRDRVIFPILRADGQVAGFGGRSRGAGEPKYLNSPESPTFKKRQLLYGLHEAASAIRSEGTALVVEGYLDVLTLSQAGMPFAVATLGTACATEQLATLLAYTRRVTFCFDGDAPGGRAAINVLRAALPLATDDVEFAFVALPGGHDPDSLVRAQGPAAMRAAAADQAGLLTHIHSAASVGCNLEEAEGRARYAHRIREYWELMPVSDVRAELVDRCARTVQVNADRLLAMWTAQQR